VKDIKLGGRVAKCDLLMALEDEDCIASLARISTVELLRAGVKEGE
jgi:hypothetical protein